MHFRILRMIATSGFLTTLECTRFVFGRVSAPDSARGAYRAALDPLSGLRGTLLLRGKEMEGKEGRRWERSQLPLRKLGPSLWSADFMAVKIRLVSWL